jgi:hypothetical protein
MGNFGSDSGFSESFGPYRPKADEISTRNDANSFIRDELVPFAGRLLGQQNLLRGQERSLYFDSQYDGCDKYIVAEMTISQEAAQTMRGLVYALELTKVEVIKGQELNAQWLLVKKNINDSYLRQYGESLIPESSLPWEYDEISIFDSTLFTLRYGARPVKSVRCGYRVRQDIKDVWVLTHETNDTPEQANALGYKSEEERILVVFSDQCHRQLSAEDVDNVYTIMHQFGHMPSDASRKQKTSAPYLYL